MHAQDQGNESAGFSKDSNDNRSPGIGQDKSNLTHCADAHKHQAGNQTVTESQVINRLQKINLHDIDQRIRIRNQRIEKNRSQFSAFHKKHAAVDTDHTDPHRHHDQRLQLAGKTKVCQNKSKNNQPNTRSRNHRILYEQTGNAGEKS